MDRGAARLESAPLDCRDVVDLRSDTQTKPSAAMREAMARAEVGDEQEREDPTVLELERRGAELLGHEEAVYLPTATMGNQIALAILGERGTELRRRGDGRTSWSPSSAARPSTPGCRRAGCPATAAACRPSSSARRMDRGRASRRRARRSSRSRTRTTPPAGPSGRSTSCARSSRPRASSGCGVHLDGARLLNAAVASGTPAAEIAGAVRHGHALPLEGARLPARRADRRLARADAPRARREAPLRRRDAAGGDRRGGGPLRARPQRRAPRRGSRARPPARRGVGGGRAAGRPRARRDELRPGRRRRARPRRARGARARARARASRSRRRSRGSCAPSRISTSPTTTSSTRSSSCRGARSTCPRLRPPSSTACSPSARPTGCRRSRPRSCRKGELALVGRRRQRELRRRPRGDARHAVPHRLDHEDVHRDRDHAALRDAGRARPRRPARAAHRRDRERLADDPPPALPPVGPAARGGGDVRDGRVADRGAAGRLDERGRVRARARREQHHYSNLAFALLGQVVARKSGHAVHASTSTSGSSARSGSTRTTWLPQAPKAQGYLVDEYARTVWTRARDRPRPAPRRPGQLWSTVEDLGRWATFLARRRRRRARPRRSIEEMWFPQVMYYPDEWVLGWGLGLHALQPATARSTAVTAARWPGTSPASTSTARRRLGAAALTNSGTRGEHGPVRDRARGEGGAELWPRADRAVAARAGAAGRRACAARPLVVGGQRVRLLVAGRDAAARSSSAAPPGTGETTFERDGDGWRAAGGRERGERLRVDGDQLIWAGYAVHARAGAVQGVSCSGERSSMATAST